MSGRGRGLKARERDILAIGLLSLAVLAVVSLHSDAAGVVGSYLAYALRWLVGQAADLPPILFAMWAFTLLWERKSAGRQRKASALFILFVVFVTALEIYEQFRLPSGTIEILMPGEVHGGGAIGRVAAQAALQAFGLPGSIVVLTALALISAVLFAESPVARLVESVVSGVLTALRSIVAALAHGSSSVAGAVRDGVVDWKEHRAGDEDEDAASAQSARRWRWPWRRTASNPSETRTRRQPKTKHAEPDTAPDYVPARRESSKTSTVESGSPEFADPFSLPVGSGRRVPRKNPLGDVVDSAADDNSAGPTPPTPVNALTGTSKPKSARSAAGRVDAGQPVDAADAVQVSLPLSEADEKSYRLPPVSLLDKPKAKDKKRPGNTPDQRSLLEETLATFGVQAKVVTVSRGPVITRYELQPAPGVAVKRITSLADDLALNLAAAGVRIEAPVPGKSVVGIEVPNKETNLVTFREVAESDAFINSRSKLAMIIGCDIAGEPVVGDLTKWLHLLIAGATGSGKSVCINSIICSLLMRAKPHEVKLLLVDPKRVELAVYDGIPHLISPVVTDPKQASGALRWAVKEMELRFKQFADRGVRNIDGFNQQVVQEDPPGEPLPYIVVIIDELADLMMVAKGEVEDSVCRLAQMARAAGMYLIVATQRPSVDVITGLIKANVPSRISFAVSSGVDSRTILDQVGAERLLGKGDMLYHPIGAAKPTRAQGTYISDREVQALVDFWKDQGTPQYQEAVLSEAPADNEEAMDEADDELFVDACRLVVETGNASISMLQRRFRVGYARAARLIDMMELRGIVGSYQGSKPREVLRTLDELEQMVL